MFRVLLTAYVTLAMLAGPSACCCTTAHVFADCFAGGSESKGAPPCCCGHEAAADDAAERATEVADGHECPSPPGDKHECPCRANKSHAVTEARKQVADLQQFRSLVSVPLQLPAVALAEAGAEVLCPDAQVRNRASHFGSAREILCALRTYLI